VVVAPAALFPLSTFAGGGGGVFKGGCWAKKAWWCFLKVVWICSMRACIFFGGGGGVNICAFVIF